MAGTGKATWVTSWRVNFCRALAAVDWGHGWCAARAAYRCVCTRGVRFCASGN